MRSLSLFLLLLACTETAPKVAEGDKLLPKISKESAKLLKPMKTQSQLLKESSKRKASKRLKLQHTATKPSAASKFKSALKWDGPVAWMSWEEMLKISKEERKPVALMLYTDWCPHCKRLAPLFQEPEIAALSKELTMVLQSSSSRPTWMKDYQRYGNYVPRLLFLDKDLKVREDLNSGNTKHPYFYTPHGKGKLIESLKKAAEK